MRILNLCARWTECGRPRVQIDWRSVARHSERWSTFRDRALEYPVHYASVANVIIRSECTRTIGAKIKLIGSRFLDLHSIERRSNASPQIESNGRLVSAPAYLNDWRGVIVIFIALRVHHGGR